MGCSITDQIRGYKTVSKKLNELNPKVPTKQLQMAINDYWLGLEDNMMTAAEKAVYKLLVEQTDGLARINLGGNKQLNEAIVILKEVDGDYIVHLESGKNYTFAKGKIKSKTTKKGATVTMPAMELTGDKQGLVVGRTRQLAVEMRDKRADTVKDKVAWGKYESKVEKGKYPYDRYSDALRKVIEPIVKPKILTDVVGLMLSEVHKDKVVPGDYNYDTHTVRIAKEPTAEEIADSAETVSVQMYLNKHGVPADIDKLTEYVGATKAQAIQRIINSVEEVKGGHTLTHELIHAGSTRFMMDNPKHAATKRIEELYQEAMKRKDEIQSKVNHGDIISTYWQNSKDEFVAEALSNPGLMQALSQVETVGKEKLSKGMLAELMQTLIGMLGLDKKVEDNLLEFTMDGFAAIMEAQAVKTDNSTDLIAQLKSEIVGSDRGTNVGDAETDVKVHGEVTDLGDTVKEMWINLDGMDNEQGNTIQETSTEFVQLQIHTLDTYQQTMKDLDTGKVTLELFENAVEQTGGQFNKKTQEMKVRWNKMSRLSRLSEIFLHETNHKMSSHVFAKNIRLKRLMEDLRDAAVDSGVDYKLFLDGIADPTAAEIELAKMKFEYTFDKTADPEEFYAYATTNEQVYNAIKDVQLKTPLIKELKLDANKRHPIKEVLNRIIDAVNNMWRLLSGRGIAGGQMIADMVTTIAKIDAEMVQTKVREETADEGITGYAAGKMNQLDETVKPVIEKVVDWTDKLQAASPTKLGKIIEQIPVLNDLMATGISQYLWRTVTQDTTKEGVAEMYMVFRHSKQVVEKHTADIRNGVKVVADKMYKDVDESTKKSITKLVMEADMAQFSAVEIEELLEGGVDNKIKELVGEIEDSMVGPISKSTMGQIDGLAKYIVEGTVHKLDQQMNAHNIANEIHIKGSKTATAIMPIELVDKLVSLKALQMSDSADKARLKRFLKDEGNKEIVDKTVRMYRSYIDGMRVDATIDGFDPIPKGYTKPADGLLRYELIPENEIKAQESVLMDLVETSPYTRINGVNYYLMTGKIKSVGFTEGALGLISHTTEGIPVSAVMRRENDMLGKKRLTDPELRRKTAALIESIANGDASKREFEMLAGKSLVPVYDHRKVVVDYRIQLSKMEKEVHLPDRETGLEDTLSSTFSRSIKTALTATENKRVVDTIIKNSALGVLENPDDYVQVEEYTEEDAMNGVKREKRHDRWEYLPDHTKNYIFKKTNGHKSIVIHKDFVELMTGEKDMTIGNFAKFGFEMRNHPVAKARVMALEAYVAETLSYVKNAMIVLNGDILVGNQVSNAMVAASHGINPVKYTKKFKERWQQLDDYNEKVQRLAELEVEQMAGSDVGRKIAQLEKQLEGNVWDELVKDGQYTALVEDINVEAKLDGQLAQIVQGQIDKSNFKGVIESVRNGLFIDKTSALYGTMLKTVHYGDAITRQIIKEELESKLAERWADKYGFGRSTNDKIKDATELKIRLDKYLEEHPELKESYAKEMRQILNYLDQLLVNYGYIQNSWWEYADKKLGLMFMKYYLNQPKALMAMTKKNPTKIALLQGAQKLTGIDIADPVDTYTNSGLDGIGYRMMLDDSPGLFVEPNILELIPSVGAAITMR